MTNAMIRPAQLTTSRGCVGSTTAINASVTLRPTTRLQSLLSINTTKFMDLRTSTQVFDVKIFYAQTTYQFTDRLLIRVPVYGPGNATGNIAVRLLNRGGLQMMEMPATGSGTSGIQQIELSLASLPPGEYVLEVKAAGTDADVKQLVAFRVTG